MSVVVELEGARAAASSHAAVMAERVYDALVDHIEDCTAGCYPWREAPWRKDDLCPEGAALVDDYAQAVLRASASALDAGAAVAVRLGYPEPPDRPRVLAGGVA